MSSFNIILGVFLALFLLIVMYWLMFNTMGVKKDPDLD